MIKIHRNWNAIYNTKKVQSNVMIGIGVGLILFALIGISTNIEDMDFLSNVLIGMLFFLPGIAMVSLNIKLKNKMKAMNKIIQYVNSTTKSKVSVDELCKTSGVNQEKVIENVMEAINKGLISGHIDEFNNLVFYSNEEIKENNSQVVVIKCRECGAKNKVIVGSTKECEYCGTILKGEFVHK